MKKRTLLFTFFIIKLWNDTGCHQKLSVYIHVACFECMYMSSVEILVGCPSARDSQKCHRTTKNIDAVFRRTTINLYPVAKTHFCVRVYSNVPSMDNQNLGRTTRNCHLVVRETTICFPLNVGCLRKKEIFQTQHYLFNTNEQYNVYWNTGIPEKESNCRFSRKYNS